MSKQLEKKYRVDSFKEMYSKIGELGAKPTIEIHSTHYYAKLDTNDTLKMIDYGDRVEVHSVSSKNGLHSIDEEILVANVEQGFEWFKQRGYAQLEALKMHDKEYSYLDGGFALYTVEDNILSVILSYAEEKLADMEELSGLEQAEQISLPYNKYVASLKELRIVDL